MKQLFDSIVRTRVIARVLCLIIAACEISANAADYELAWTTIDGGGGSGAAGQFSLEGTIGQVDAATFSGGPYTLDGGFWPGVIETLGARRLLQIAPSASGCIVSWPAGLTGFVLETATALPGTWIPVDVPVLVVNGRSTVSLMATPGPRFFRLKKI